MRRMVVTVAVVAVAAALIGCGGGNTPKATYEKMWKAAEAGHRELCLSYFTKDSQANIVELEQMAGELTGEANVIGKIMARAKTSVLEFGEQKISGDTATLLVTIDGETKPTRFVREDGTWKIDAEIDMEKMRKGAKFLKGLKGLKDALDKRKKGK
ncbi:hypothetical protein ACFL09_04605 [Planctomycetota bacterium]